MSEQKLREFGAQAEGLVSLPDYAELDRRGRKLHQRRLAGGAAVAACVLTVVGIAVAQNDSPRAVEPVEPPDDAPAGAQPYPGAVMEDLDAGTYTLEVSWRSHYPVARITVPAGWNAWQGPNRFDGREPGRSNEEALGATNWYVGVLVVDVDAVASRPCSAPQDGDSVGATAAAQVRAITRIPGYRIEQSQEPVDMFGHPATHLELYPTPALQACKSDFNLFDTAAHGVVGGDGTDRSDVWVVDVDGIPVLVEAASTTHAPPAVQRELTAVVDSIEFSFEE